MAVLKDYVTGRVKFQYYRAGNLYYEATTANGDILVFPVPITDCGEATFLAQDKAMLFMRYIRKHLEAIRDADSQA